MKVESVKRKGRGARVTVSFTDDSESLELSAEVAKKAGLRKGIELSAAQLARLQHDDFAWRCKEAALRLLDHRARSAVELRRRLRVRSFPDDVIDACLADLERAGLIDDARFADALARERLRSKPMGKRRLRSEMRARGIAEPTADEAIEEAYLAESGTEYDLAVRAARKFRRRADKDQLSERRRLYAFLARRGFDSEAVMSVVDELLPHDE